MALRSLFQWLKGNGPLGTYSSYFSTTCLIFIKSAYDKDMLQSQTSIRYGVEEKENTNSHVTAKSSAKSQLN